MGKPKRLYGNIIDPDLCRVVDLLEAAKTLGFETKMNQIFELPGNPDIEGFDPIVIKRNYKGLQNPGIFDDFYKEVVTTVTDYPYRTFIERANTAYNIAHDRILLESTPNPEIPPNWFESVFFAIEWTPVKTFLGDMPSLTLSRLMQDSIERDGAAEDLRKERRDNLEAAIAYVLKNGGPHRLVGAVWTYIVAYVMELVVHQMQMTINSSHKFDALPCIPIQVLGTANTEISTTVVTKLDLDAIVRAMRVVACYGLYVNVSELLRIYSVASMQRSICYMKSTEDAGEEEGEDVAVDDVARDDDVYDDEEE